MSDRPPERPCGGCEVCCVVLDVPPLNKASGERCRHLTGSGCGIYSDRPSLCGGFSCNWAMGDPILPEALRPDRSGVLIWVEHTDLGLTIQVREQRKDALQHPDIQRAMTHYRSLFPVSLIDFMGTKQLGMPGAASIDLS